MVYYYKIDFKKGKFILTENNVDEHSVFLEDFKVEVLKKMLENSFFNSPLKCLDYLRGALDMDEEDGIDVGSYYSLVKAIVNRSFQTDFEIAEPKFYVHVLPTPFDYLNVKHDGTVSIDDSTERGGFKTKFTMVEIEKMKHDSRFKGINFDKCLEEVEE